MTPPHPEREVTDASVIEAARRLTKAQRAAVLSACIHEARGEGPQWFLPLSTRVATERAIRRAGLLLYAYITATHSVGSRAYLNAAGLAVRAHLLASQGPA